MRKAETIQEAFRCLNCGGSVWHRDQPVELKNGVLSYVNRGQNVMLNGNGLVDWEVDLDANGFIDVIPYVSRGLFRIESPEGETCILSDAINHVGFLGYVWVNGENPVLTNSCRVWITEDGKASECKRHNNTLTTCKAVRFRKTI